MKNKPCKECPWTKMNKHSIKFRESTLKMKSIGVYQHACHMTTLDIWGLTNKINSKTTCKGQNLIINDGKQTN